MLRRAERGAHCQGGGSMIEQPSTELRYSLAFETMFYPLQSSLEIGTLQVDFEGHHQHTNPSWLHQDFLAPNSCSVPTC